MYTESSLRKNLFLIADCIAVLVNFTLLSIWQSYPFLKSWRFLLSMTLLTVIMTVVSNDYSLAHRRNLQQEIHYSFKFTLKLLNAFILTLFFSQYIGKVYVTQLGFDFILLQFVLQFILVYVFRYIAVSIANRIDHKMKNVILVTNFSSPVELEKILNKHRYKVVAYLTNKSNVDATLPTLKNFNDVERFMQENIVHEVFVDLDARQNFIEEQEYFNAFGISVTICMTDGRLPNLIVQEMDTVNFVTRALKVTNYRYVFIKRLLDIIGSFVGLLIAFIVGCVIYPIIQKQSRGPLLFTQDRVGQNGEVFKIYKFRSMYLGAEENKKDLMLENKLKTDLMFKMENDPRIFPFGQKIRDWSLDELPQFWNVLKGDMSLVGTRPPTLEEYQKYNLPHFKRLLAKPGITGMWQVSGRSNIKDFEDVVSLDLEYIKNWSIRLDLKIILKTIKVVLKREGSS